MLVLAKAKIPLPVGRRDLDFFDDVSERWVCVPVFRLTYIEVLSAMKGRLHKDGFNINRVMRSELVEYIPGPKQQRYPYHA